MAGSSRTIGIIAGRDLYPAEWIQAARRSQPGLRIVMVAFHKETRPDVAAMADEVEWMRVGQLSRPIKFLREHGAGEAVMAGQLAPGNLFALRPDLRSLKMLARIPERNAESLFGAVADEMARDGITLLPATTFMEDQLPGEGPVCGPKFSARQLQDAAFGFRMAKETSRLDIGQAVVVRHGTVLAVEAFEGTNECIRRGGALGKRKHAMLVKVSKPRQDFRFDVPVVGAKTIEVCAAAGVGAIAVEAGRIMMLEREKVAQWCREHGIGIHAVGPGAA